VVNCSKQPNRSKLVGFSAQPRPKFGKIFRHDEFATQGYNIVQRNQGATVAQPCGLGLYNRWGRIFSMHAGVISILDHR